MPETENPWENATSDSSWRQANFSMEEAAEGYHNNIENDDVDAGDHCRVARCVVNTCHVGDALIGFLMLLYSFVLRMEENSPKAIAWIFFSLGTLLAFRAAVGTWSVYHDLLGRMGILLSSYVSVLLSFSLFVCSMVSLGMRQKIALYLTAHQGDLHLPPKVVTFTSSHVHFIWVTLLVSCLVEAVRWIIMSKFHECMIEEDELSIQLLPPSSARQNRKPWWWSTRRNGNVGRHDLAGPLLEPSWTATSNHGWNKPFWKRIFPRGPTSERNVRDDGSVDFASVQEEWASRSEEDPLWWTRDEGDSQNRS